MSENLIQYVIVRSDLDWPLGAIIAQACHATTAANHIFRDDSDTQQYLDDFDHMHKAVLKISTEDELRQLSTRLLENDIKHKLWIEQPENVATCIAIKPYPKLIVQKHVKKLRLLNAMNSTMSEPSPK